VATDALREIASRGRLPILCGGSGFYIRALIDGLFPGPTRDEALRARFESAEERRPGIVHRYLRRADPAAAARIAPGDIHKTVRAAEICWQARRPATELFSELGRAALSGFRAYHIGLDPPREALYEKINSRSRHLFEMGLIEEVRHLLDCGYPANSKAFESVGYRQVIDYLEGRSTFEQAVSDTAQKTRNYAKRQRTWFRKDPRIQWFANFGGDPSVRAEALAILQANILDGSGTFF
jgi:tRNA dimethylallyltransferase